MYDSVDDRIQVWKSIHNHMYEITDKTDLLT